MANNFRLSPQVQQIQAMSPYIDILTNAPLTFFREPPTEVQCSSHPQHENPVPTRWKDAGSWGARHLHDNAPFTLWVEEARTFRSPTKEETQWVLQTFEAQHMGMSGWYMWIETSNPPKPIPLTVGCTPVMFVDVRPTIPIPKSPYPNPRLQDPCPGVYWPKMSFPTREQNAKVLTSLVAFANVRAIIYLPCWTIVELYSGDGRVYEPRSLPGRVAGRTTLYHHTGKPFYCDIQSRTRARLLDPAQHVSSPMPQDNSNYLRGQKLTPGCRVESGYGPIDSPFQFATAATTLGVKLRNVRGQERVTVAHHSFLHSGEVWHPKTNDDLVGTVVDTRPELDVALVHFTSAASARFTNSCYFQAEPTRSLKPGDTIQAGSWSEVDGMSSGLVSLLTVGKYFRRPQRPPGWAEIPFEYWRPDSVHTVFGAINPVIAEEISGAPIVEVESRAVTGFFHLFNGLDCISAHLDDLIAEGWHVV
ncbi:Uncharacterized protein PECH_005270 [Penicillium ucsense]|uniref:Uncharacterized protein n=1 Tax=Penicillium ucsense TaxID=2839758 RepID=A0A8J8VW16_9EURO|nr:Uncharacterized protein PECM_004835 [Penicillium ucsense]KAF7724436.1 Uncharacterized protein PECH_005270 [Penicillium ucsense]